MKQLPGKVQVSVILIFILIIVGCSSEISYKILSFVFDGVPEPAKNEIVNASDTTLNVIDNSAKDSIEQTVKKTLFVHSPYKERKCSSCHDQNNIGDLQSKMPELCYGCHTDFDSQYKIVHGPVEAGYCNTCHLPHISENEYLLIRTGNDLCIYCHDKNDIYSGNIHSNIMNLKCSECHHVHGGDEKSLLKKGTCYFCHEDFNAKYEFLHGPVAGNYCSSCHDSHNSKTKGLLLRTGQQLCLYCHDFKRLKTKEPHEDIADTDCTECHDPHGGVNKELLY